MRHGLAIGVVVLLAACGSGEDARPPPDSNREELIAFSRESGRGSNREEALYVMRPDGTGVRRLTRPAPEASYPAWSPDGTRLAYTSTQVHGIDSLRATEIYVADPNGTNVRRLTNDRVGEFGLRWVGDDRLVFSSCWNEEKPDTGGLETIGADGEGRERVLAAPAAAAMLWGAALSADGAKVAFALPRAGERWPARDERFFWWWKNLDLYVVASDGSDRRRLTDSPGNDSRPVWSPDGSRIVFESDRDENGDCVFYECGGHATELYVMDADGSNQLRLTRTRASEHYPAWSPDGTRIVFARTLDDDEDDFELYVINTDGTCERRLTNNTEEDEMPSWTGTGEGPLEC